MKRLILWAVIISLILSFCNFYTILDLEINTLKIINHNLDILQTHGNIEEKTIYILNNFNNRIKKLEQK